jgi:6-phospho-beta-glucosidase
VAAIRIAYLGGGSTRAPGTMEAFIDHASAFAGSEVCLIDIDEEHLALVQRLAARMARARGADLTITATTDRLEGFRDADAVLLSFRPGGMEARVLDETIPLGQGIVGQETQGPGGFFMALRAIAVLIEVADELERVAPGTKVFNYTNPVNIVAEAWTHHSSIPLVSLCEGPIVFPRELARDIGLEYDKAEARMVGLNHACWAIEQTYDGRPFGPILEERYAALAEHPNGVEPDAMRLLELAVRMGRIGAGYFKYYYFEDDVLRELQERPTTRAQDIVSSTPGYWRHYAEQAESDDPVLDEAQSRTGIHELELAVELMDACFNGKDGVFPMNVPNAGSVLPGFPEDLVVEVYGRAKDGWIEPEQQPALPRHVRGLLESLAEYQALSAEAAWSGDRNDAVRALCSNPLVRTLPRAERLFSELAHAHRAHLPRRLAA